MPRPNLEAVADLVSDGRKVDWDRLEAEATGDDDRRVLRNLRLVESLTQYHRAAAGPRTVAAGAVAGFRWGDLEVRAQIGSGAFGDVFRAWDAKLEREVALKLIRADAAGGADGERVLREARLLARVRHPNVVTVYRADRHDGRTGIEMELIRGRSLSRRMEEEGKLGAREAAILGVEVCRALSAVHAAGLVHRDVKAANVMREDGGRIVLMDFGAGSDAGSVAEGSLSGTPQYIAPEVFLGGKATPRSDVYSVAVLLYHLVSGSYPVEARNLRELRERIGRREMRLLRDSRPDLPEEYHRVIERGLSWDPAERFESAGAMEQALSAFLGSGARAGAVAPGRRWIWIGGAALLAVAAGVFALRNWTPAAPERPDHALSAPYTVEAALYRMRGGATRERIDDNGRVGPGDELALEFKASVPVHVYVIDEDELGHAFALFPLPDVTPQNPLAAGQAHLLPGTGPDGAAKYWKVDTAGGREHLLVLASPDRLVEFEAELNLLARPSAGAPAIPVSDRARVVLRGIGGLVDRPAEAASPATAASIFEMAEKLAGRSEQVRGRWLRRIDLQNPKPDR